MAAGKNYIKDFINDYCVIDVETTGISFYYDEIIEIGLLRVRDNEIVESYQQLIKPEEEIDSFVTYLTGITNDMVKDMPSIMEVKKEVLEFIGSDIIIGHNTSFDRNFIEKGFNIKLNNKYMDTLQFSRKVFPELKRHRLVDMTEYLNIEKSNHRALQDCISTKLLYDKIKQTMEEKKLGIYDLWKKKVKKSIDMKSMVPEKDDIDEDNFFYNRVISFTGKLEKMTRREAAQLVVNKGGIPSNGFNKKTNYLILGDNSYNHSIKNGKKSSKHLQALKAIEEGRDLEIIDELSFYDLLDE